MKNKGFTLVELLAVIIIIALLALLTTTSITKIVKDSKSKLSQVQINLIQSAAKLWGAENMELLPEVNECGYITLGYLKDEGLFDDNVVDPQTKEPISDSLKIKVSTSLTSTGKAITNYEVDPESVVGCTQLYEEEE